SLRTLPRPPPSPALPYTTLFRSPPGWQRCTRRATHRRPQVAAGRAFAGARIAAVSVHRWDPDEVAVRVGHHEGAAEDVVVGLLHDADALRDPPRVGLVDHRRRTGHHQPDLAGARDVRYGELAPPGPQGEQDARGDLEGHVAGV